MKRLKIALFFGVALFSLFGFVGCGELRQRKDTGVPAPENPDVILATTTSANDTGLLDTLTVIFGQQTGYRVKIISVGSGAALELGRRGEADIVIAHSAQAELEMLQAGYLSDRVFLMVNDFVIAGPASDPANVKGMESPSDALTRLAERRARFVSRGDKSGTHKKELSLWEAAGITPSGAWYVESGTGMGQTLRIAEEKQAYVLTDRGTFLVHSEQGSGMAILVEGASVLLNPYHIMPVNHAKHPKVNTEGAQAFLEFMMSEETQAFICKFGLDRFGIPLFYNATSPKAVLAREK